MFPAAAPDLGGEQDGPPSPVTVVHKLQVKNPKIIVLKKIMTAAPDLGGEQDGPPSPVTIVHKLKIENLKIIFF